MDVPFIFGTFDFDAKFESLFFFSITMDICKEKLTLKIRLPHQCMKKFTENQSSLKSESMVIFMKSEFIFTHI